MFFNGSVFWYIMGILTILVGAGAVVWARDLHLKMFWWKWLLVIVWYVLLMMSVYAAFTFIGEDESAAGMRFLLFAGVVLVILGAGLVRLLLQGRETQVKT